MKIAYRTPNFQPWKHEMIDRVNVIADEYKAQGYTLTARGMYYQFVSRDWLPMRWFCEKAGSVNNDKSYENLCGIIGDGQYCGLIDWDAIDDTTRDINKNSHWDNAAQIISGARHSFAMDHWAGQKNRVEVWVEKDALKAIVARAARKLDVPFFSCRGYVSRTSMHDAAMRYKKLIRKGLKVTILHLGDHDPSGIDMSRDIEDRIREFLGDDEHGFELKRIGLTIEQVRKLNPPPNPTKLNDSRAKGYVEKYGLKCWELDALPPAAIAKLIEKEVVALRDQKIYDATVSQETFEKKVLELLDDNWDKAARVVHKKFGEKDPTDMEFVGVLTRGQVKEIAARLLESYDRGEVGWIVREVTEVLNVDELTREDHAAIEAITFKCQSCGCWSKIQDQGPNSDEDWMLCKHCDESEDDDDESDDDSSDDEGDDD